MSSLPVPADAIAEVDAAAAELEHAADRLFEIAERLRQAADDNPEQAVFLREESVLLIETCSFQDIVGQRLAKIRDAFVTTGTTDTHAGQKATDTRKHARPDADLLNGPALDGAGVDQSVVDDMFDD